MFINSVDRSIVRVSGILVLVRELTQLRIELDYISSHSKGDSHFVGNASVVKSSCIERLYRQQQTIAIFRMSKRNTICNCANLLYGWRARRAGFRLIIARRSMGASQANNSWPRIGELNTCAEQKLRNALCGSLCSPSRMVSVNNSFGFLYHAHSGCWKYI